jgi:hypothetical protein
MSDRGYAAEVAQASAQRAEVLYTLYPPTHVAMFLGELVDDLVVPIVPVRGKAKVGKRIFL